jgi:hypothetical protein
MQQLLLNLLVVAATVYYVPRNKLPNETILLIALASVVGFLLVERLMGDSMEGFRIYAKKNTSTGKWIVSQNRQSESNGWISGKPIYREVANPNIISQYKQGKNLDTDPKFEKGYRIWSGGGEIWTNDIEQGPAITTSPSPTTTPTPTTTTTTTTTPTTIITITPPTPSPPATPPTTSPPPATTLPDANPGDYGIAPSALVTQAPSEDTGIIAWIKNLGK